MGYYIETPGSNKQKAKIICEQHDAIQIPQPKTFQEIPAEMALICVVDNGPFEAAGFAHNEREFQEFSNPRDSRSKTWILMDRTKAEVLSGYRK